MSVLVLAFGHPSITDDQCISNTCSDYLCTQNIDIWRWIFYICALVGIIATILAITLYFIQKQRNRGSFEIPMRMSELQEYFLPRDVDRNRVIIEDQEENEESV